MGLTPVEDVRLADPGPHRVGTGLDLGDHAALHSPVAHDLVDDRGRGLVDHRRGVVGHDPEPLDVGQEDQLLGLQRFRQRTGHRVGVDVVGLTGLVGPDRRHDGDQPLRQQPLEHGGVDHRHVADEAEVGVPRGGRDEVGILAGQPDGDRSVHVDGRHDVAVDLAHQHHAGDVERVGVGDPQPVAEFGLLAEPFHQLADLGPAAVHHDRQHAHGAHEDHVLGERGQRIARDQPRPRFTRSAAAACNALPPYLTTTIFSQKRRM